VFLEGEFQRSLYLPLVVYLPLMLRVLVIALKPPGCLA
jgi:hypothetical protein